MNYFERDCWLILGLPFDAVDLHGAAQHINDAIANKQPYFISTPNINFSITAQKDDDFFDSVVASDLSVADGMPLIWISKLLGIPISERVAGSDLFDYLSQQQRHKPISIFFFGGQSGVAKRAHLTLNSQSNSLISCGFFDPGFVSLEQMSTDSIVNSINEAHADFIIVALGAKKGQAWIQRNRTKLNAPVISHLGAVINFVAATVDRAPLCWRRCGFEWLWRIKQEPALWQRYWCDGIGLLRLLFFNVFPLAVYDRVLRYSTSSDRFTISESDNQIQLRGAIAYHSLEQVKQAFRRQIENHEQSVTIDFADVTYFDNAFMANLLLLQRYLKQQNRYLYLAKLPKRSKRLLRLSGVLSRFNVPSADA